MGIEKLHTLQRTAFRKRADADERDTQFLHEKCHVCHKVGHLNTAKEDGNNIFSLENSDFMRILKTNGKNVKMLMDTGVQVSVININDFNQIAAEKEIRQFNGTVKDYNDKQVIICGQAIVHVTYKGFDDKLKLLIAPHGRNIHGANWMKSIQPDICVNVLERTASIVLKEDAVPIFIKPRVIPYGIRKDVKTEIDRLVSD